MFTAAQHAPKAKVSVTFSYFLLFRSGRFALPRLIIPRILILGGTDVNVHARCSSKSSVVHRVASGSVRVVAFSKQLGDEFVKVLASPCSLSLSLTAHVLLICRAFYSLAVATLFTSHQYQARCSSKSSVVLLASGSVRVVAFSRQLGDEFVITKNEALCVSHRY